MRLQVGQKSKTEKEKGKKQEEVKAGCGRGKLGLRVGPTFRKI
jgi:hypothetical protein